MSRVQSPYRVGDLVEVRGKEEILRTLDAEGRLDGLPFMPQMFDLCGKRFAVLARAHKTCDVVGGKCRWLGDAVHLDVRCDGAAYDGCQQGCLIFWKQAWLRRADSDSLEKFKPSRVADHEMNAMCTEDDVWRSRLALSQDGTGEKIYRCQATQVPYFTRPLAWWDIRQYVEDYTSGNVTLERLARGTLYQAYHHGTQAWRHRFGRPARWLYDRFQELIDGVPFPRRPGRLPHGSPTPSASLNLKPGDLVRVKSQAEILETITKGGMNRGLLFDKEMVPFCGKVFRVHKRVTTFVNERTGRLSTLKTPAVILDGVWCQSRYSNHKMFCPRALYSWWREIWLERVDENNDAPAVLNDLKFFKDGRSLLVPPSRKPTD